MSYISGKNNDFFLKKKIMVRGFLVFFLKKFFYFSFPATASCSCSFFSFLASLGLYFTKLEQTFSENVEGKGGKHSLFNIQ